MKILVADGSRVMRQIVIRTLRQAGYVGHDIVEAQNGRQALELVHREAPDLVLSEWSMPGMSGIDVLDSLRAAGCRVPFGFVTADCSAEVRARAEAGGALFVLGKPFTLEAFDDAFGSPAHDRSDTTAASYLPSTKEVRDLWTGLLGRNVSVSPSPPLAPGPRTPCTIGVYVDDALQVTALVVVDLPLSARAAAAIGLVPLPGAEAAIEDGTLDTMLRENLHEVLNIASSLFNVEGATHLRLYDVHHAGLPVPPGVLAMALTLGRREDLAVDVAGYGQGRLSLVLVR